MPPGHLPPDRRPSPPKVTEKYVRKIIKIPEFYMDFAPKVPEFYIIGRKIYPDF